MRRSPWCLALGLLAFLVGANAAAAEDSRWALAPHACDGELLTREETPLILDGGEIRWFDLACRVVSRYKVKDTLYLQAECLREGKAGTVAIMLEPKGERLRVGWNREPIREMRRCANAAGFFR